jgi:hypothetical protein
MNSGSFPPCGGGLGWGERALLGAGLPTPPFARPKVSMRISETCGRAKCGVRRPAHSSSAQSCGPVGDATGLLGVGERDGHEIRRDVRHSTFKRISELFMSGRICPSLLEGCGVVGEGGVRATRFVPTAQGRIADRRQFDRVFRTRDSLSRANRAIRSRGSAAKWPQRAYPMKWRRAKNNLGRY